VVEARIIARRPADRCPYCRGELRTEDLVICGGCETTYHAGCWTEGGEVCATTGCAAAPTRGRARVTPEATPPSPIVPQWSWVPYVIVASLLLFVLGVVGFHVRSKMPPPSTPAQQVAEAHARALALRAQGKYVEAAWALRHVESLYLRTGRRDVLHALQRELFLLADLTPEQQARLAAAEREADPWRRVALLEPLYAELEEISRRTSRSDPPAYERARHVEKQLEAARRAAARQ
jgi:hypothetical protein